MTLLIRNTTIVTGDDAGTIHYGAALAVSGNRIVAIGPDAEVAARHPGADRRFARLLRPYELVGAGRGPAGSGLHLLVG